MGLQPQKIIAVTLLFLPPFDLPPSALEGAAPSVSTGQITARGSHTCILRADGKAVCWGDNTLGQLGAPAALAIPAPRVVPGGFIYSRIVTGYAHTCAVRTDHRV